jgi:hypothetical protein
MLFFFITPFDRRSASNHHHHHHLLSILVLILLTYSTCVSRTNASLSSFNPNSPEQRQWENILPNNKYPTDRLERTERGAGYFVYRKGGYLIFIPDRKHHFTKNIRPYIGRRR